jgi:myo-inositol-hexaphosphate 3-phosphohydrolase
VKDWIDPGLLAWLAAGATALVALVVLSLALFSPRSDSSLNSSPASIAPTTTTGDARRVAATVETEPVPHSADAADDAAIWIHPTDPSLSTVLGTDKVEGGGLGVYDLSGKQLFFYFDGNLNNVDLRYNFPLGDTRVSLVGLTKRNQPATLIFYEVNVADRSLVQAGVVPLAELGIEQPRGFALYRSPASGKYFAFVTDSRTNAVSQLELDGASGTVTATLARSIRLDSAIEGLVADDGLGRLYVSEEEVGIWRYGAEPGDGDARTLVDSVFASGGHLTPSIKGTAIYYRGDGDGYLIAASQAGGNFSAYTRVDNVFLGSFEVQSGDGVDGVSGQDGIDVTNVALGQGIPDGVFVTQDHVNSNAGNGNDGNQNYKLVPWSRIAAAFTPPLSVDTSYDPHLIGAPGTP